MGITPHHRHLFVMRHVTYSCLPPGDSGNSLHSYAIPLSIFFFTVNIFRLEKFWAIFFYSVTLLIMLLLISIPHFLLSSFINASFSMYGMRAQSSVKTLFPRCLSPSNIADIALPRMTPPIAAILDRLNSSRSVRISYLHRQTTLEVSDFQLLLALHTDHVQTLTYLPFQKLPVYKSNWMLHVPAI